MGMKERVIDALHVARYGEDTAPAVADEELVRLAEEALTPPYDSRTLSTEQLMTLRNLSQTGSIMGAREIGRLLDHIEAREA
jgi:hypothetical protein